MSTFFAASQQCEAGKARTRHETNTALLRLPASSPSLIKSSHCFHHFASKNRQSVIKGSAPTTYANWARGNSLPPLTSVHDLGASESAPTDSTVVDFGSVPIEVVASQEAHRKRLEVRKNELLVLEERDANDVARRAKAKRLDEERQRRIRRIAAGLQDLNTIDFDPEEDAPDTKLRSKVVGTAYHPQLSDGTLTATHPRDSSATISDYFRNRAPPMMYATSAVYGTPIHATLAEAEAVRALESVGMLGGAANSAATMADGGNNTNESSFNGDTNTISTGGRVRGCTNQLRALLQQQQQLSGGLQGLTQSVGEKAANNAKNYLRGKYGPSMLWADDNGGNSITSSNTVDGPPPSVYSNVVGGPMSVGATPTSTFLTASGPQIQHGIPRRLLGQSASQLAEALIERELRDGNKW